MANWFHGVRKTAGYALFVLSCLSWAALPAIPFAPLDGVEKAAWAAGLLIFGEVTWWLMVALLGKEIIDWWRQGWRWLRAEALRRLVPRKPAGKPGVNHAKP